jgi:hypothetical protein
MTEAELKDSVHTLVDKLIESSGRYRDRDNTIYLNFAYDNFEEYINKFGQFFILRFSTFDIYLAAVIRSFVNAQIGFMKNKEEYSEQGVELWERLIKEVCDEHVSEFKKIISKSHPLPYQFLVQQYEKTI